MLNDPVALARTHVLKGREIVAQQRFLIERLRTLRLDLTEAEDLLGRFEDCLRIFEDDLERLEGEASR